MCIEKITRKYPHTPGCLTAEQETNRQHKQHSTTQQRTNGARVRQQVNHILEPRPLHSRLHPLKSFVCQMSCHNRRSYTWDRITQEQQQTDYRYVRTSMPTMLADFAFSTAGHGRNKTDQGVAWHRTYGLFLGTSDSDTSMRATLCIP